MNITKSSVPLYNGDPYYNFNREGFLLNRWRVFGDSVRRRLLLKPEEDTTSLKNYYDNIFENKKKTSAGTKNFPVKRSASPKTPGSKNSSGERYLRPNAYSEMGTVGGNKYSPPQYDSIPGQESPLSFEIFDSNNLNESSDEKKDGWNEFYNKLPDDDDIKVEADRLRVKYTDARIEFFKKNLPYKYSQLFIEEQNRNLDREIHQIYVKYLKNKKEPAILPSKAFIELKKQNSKNNHSSKHGIKRILQHSPTSDHQITLSEWKNQEIPLTIESKYKLPSIRGLRDSFNKRLKGFLARFKRDTEVTPTEISRDFSTPHISEVQSIRRSMIAQINKSHKLLQGIEESTTF